MESMDMQTVTSPALQMSPPSVSPGRAAQTPASIASASEPETVELASRKTPSPAPANVIRLVYATGSIITPGRSSHIDILA